MPTVNLVNVLARDNARSNLFAARAARDEAWLTVERLRAEGADDDTLRSQWEAVESATDNLEAALDEWIKHQPRRTVLPARR